MIARLRGKLVLACMLSLFVVLFSVILVLNLAYFDNAVDNADAMLEMLHENGDGFPEDGPPPSHDPPPSKKPDERKPREKKSLAELLFESPELPYTTRFFSVTLRDGGIVSYDIDKIAAVDEATAGDFALQAVERGRERGFLEKFRYMVFEEEDGRTLALFLDCEHSLESCRNVLLLSICASALGFIAVFLLIVLLSGRIVKPFAMNYQKQRRFISDAGHELRTPLTIINADAEILELETGENEWIDDIRSQTDRLARLTENLIYLSKADENVAPPMVDFLISDAVSEAAASFQNLARTRSRELELQIAPLLSCRGNSDMIRQLVSILLDNALKYSTDARPITLRLEKHGKGVQLTVENAAENVSDDMVLSMFDRFYRGDPSRSSEVKGYGMGLSIALAIANAHRGRIFASVPEENVLRITLQLPG